MKLTVSKSRNAASLYVTQSIYDNGKRTSRIVEKLGTEKELREKLNGEDPYEWAKKYIEKLNQEEKDAKRLVTASFSPTKVIPKNQQVSYNGGYLFLQKIYYSLHMDKICMAIKKKYKFTFDLNLILSYLIYGRILFPASKLATKESANTLIESKPFELQHLYRGLGVLAKEHDFIQSELYKNSLALSARNTKVLFYDCTNFYFEIEQEDGIRQYGKNKENRPNPIVEMGLFMDGDGIPLAFSIHPGNTNEQVTLKPLEKKILSDFSLSQFVVCTDAGLSSAANRRFNDIQGRAFITTQSLKKLKGFLMDWAVDSKGWRLSGQKSKASAQEGLYDLAKIEAFYQNDELPEEQKEALESKVFYKERWIKEGSLEQRLVVTYSIKYRNYQRHIRNKQVERAQKVIDKNPTKLKKCNANDYKRFIKKEHCTLDGEKAEKELLSIDQDIIDKEARFDGFYAICTNLEDDIEDIVKSNKRRWEIEECFRIMKSEFKARPVFLSRDDRIQAHFMTCFLSLVIYRLLEKQLMPKEDSHGMFTCPEILSTLRGMNFYKIPSEGYVPTYKRTDLTDALHDKFGFRTDYEIVNTKELKKIIKLSKKS